MALHEVFIPGVGIVHAGFDWVGVSAIDGEFKRLASRYEASWYYNIKGLDDEEEVYAAFVKKGELKKIPLSGASLIRKNLKDDESFISLLKIDEQNYWLLVMEGGLPICSSMNQSIDYVADFSDTLHNLRNILGSYKNPTEIPFFTDCDEITQEIAYPLSVRPYSLDILAESITKKDLLKLKFKRYTPVPVVGISVVIFFIVLAALGTWYWLDMQENDVKQAKERKRQELNRRKAELANQVDEAINSAPPASMSAKAYMAAIGSAPINISGWALNDAACAAGQCNLTYKGLSFATWKGYMLKKPKSWPAPVFGNDFNVVIQPLPVEFTESERRTTESLPKKADIVLDFGNLAQLSKELNISVRLDGVPSRVAGTASDSWVPLQARFSASGSVPLLDGFVQRLPLTVGLRTLDVRIGDKLSFELSGDLYANP